MTHQRTTSTANGTSQPTTDMANTYVWWTGALNNVTTYKPDINQSTTYTSTYSYNFQGQLSGVNIQDARPRTVSFVTNPEGQILLRKEHDNNSSLGDPIESHYYFAGEGLGVISNNGSRR